MNENVNSRFEEARELMGFFSPEQLLLPEMKLAVNFENIVYYRALRKALESGDKIFFASQNIEFLETKIPCECEMNLCLDKIGVVATVEKCRKISNGTYQAIFSGIKRARLISTRIEDKINYCKIEILSDVVISKEEEDYFLKKLWHFVDSFLSSMKADKSFNLNDTKKNASLGEATDIIAATFFPDYERKMKILEENDPTKRCDFLIKSFVNDVAMLDFEKDLFSKTVESLKEAEKEHFLREQLKQIKSELRDDGDDSLYFRITDAPIPENVKEVLLKQYDKVMKSPYGSAESSVLSSYIDTCLELPWLVSTDDRLDIDEVRNYLEESHYGMKKLKKRIQEYIAVKMLDADPNGQILCLVGAPGVGKTSIAEAIATAMGRKYARVSLGGIRDEAEIRGHRKTYVGSMPGRIITAIKNAGVNNPLILLDEIDKLTADAHGDPASALLEVLDSEQNSNFRDHYIEIPFDLSKCFFIATANTVSTIPKPLLDRMELIELESYTEVEKYQIAEKYLVPKQIKKHGLKKSQIKFTPDGINKIIESYTREAGVRNLNREIGAVCRKCAQDIVEKKYSKIILNSKRIVEILGPEYYSGESVFEEDLIGCVNGLAWTSVGGELMRIEALSMVGNGKIELTGSLGTVMKESAMAAISYIRKHAEEYGIDPSFYSKNDIHIHAPEGAVPKDGPSAGIAMTTAILSELSQRKINRYVAMTGEITLTGRVLPIGGLKEKTMAAYKAGIKKVIVPLENKKDINKLEGDIKNELEFIYVSNYSQVPPLVFTE